MVNRAWKWIILGLFFILSLVLMLLNIGSAYLSYSVLCFVLVCVIVIFYLVSYFISPMIKLKSFTDNNIVKFTSQLKRVGFSFDWSRVVDTTDENYYKWTQWIFLKMFEKGLVFRDQALVNYCPHCKVEINHVECKNDEDVYEFRLDFEEGVFADEIEESLAHEWPSGLWKIHVGEEAAE